MKLKHYLSNFFGRLLSKTKVGRRLIDSNLWYSIEEMHIYAWNKITATGDLKYLFRNEKGFIAQRHKDHWIGLWQQYINEFGIDPEFAEKIRIMRRLSELNYQYIITGDRFLLNLIEIAELDLKSWGPQVEIKFFDVLDHVEKYKGYQIDPKQISVVRWIYTLKNMTKRIERESAQIKGNRYGNQGQ